MTLNPDGSLRTISAKELSNTKWIVPKGKQIKWGRWLLVPSTLVIRYMPTDYEIDLERILAPADIWDWILHINGKTSSWATTGNNKAIIIADLINAFDDLYYPGDHNEFTHITPSPKNYLQKKIKSREFGLANGAIEVVTEQTT